MFFFNGRIRNAHIVPIVTRDRSYTHKVSQSVIIIGCLSIVISLILILIGIISETDKQKYFAIGTISLCMGFCLTIFVCFYTKLSICYRNWAYGPHVTPSNMENSVRTTAGDISISYVADASKIAQRTSTVIVPPVATIPNVGIHKSRTARAINFDRTSIQIT